MYQRTAIQELWGYRPLVLLLAAWAGLSLLFLPLFSKSDLKWRWLLLSTSSGLLLGLGFPELIPFPFFTFIGFVPLLILESEISRFANKKGRTLLCYSYVSFVLWNIIATYWVSNAAIAAGLFAILVNSMLMCIPFWLFHKSKQAMPNLAAFALIAYWISFEYIHLNWDLSWPWLTLGNSFAEFPSLIQWYEYTGHLGGTLWILWVNLTLYKFWQGYKEEKKLPFLTSIGLMVIPIALSLFIYYTYEEKGRAVEVAVVQPNYEPHYVKFSIPEQTQVQHFLDLSEQVIGESTEYLVFPESSFGYTETHAIHDYPAIRQLKGFLSNYPRLNLVTGFNAYTEFLPTETLTPNTRINIRPTGDTVRYEVLNIATQLSSGNENIPIYKKSKLVPGPEIFPYQAVLSVFKPIVDQLGGTTAGVGTQKERSVFTSKSGSVAPVICYESVYGAYFTEYIDKGAEAAFIVTNDGWWDNTAGHRQHLHYASLRAIETRRSIARSANSGISAYINQKGEIKKPTKYGESAAIIDKILFNDSRTFYVIWKDLIARIALLTSLMLLLNTLAKVWQKKVNPTV